MCVYHVPSAGATAVANTQILTAKMEPVCLTRIILPVPARSSPKQLDTV